MLNFKHFAVFQSLENGFDDNFIFEGTIDQFCDSFGGGSFGGDPATTFEDCLAVVEASGWTAYAKIEKDGDIVLPPLTRPVFAVFLNTNTSFDKNLIFHGTSVEFAAQEGEMSSNPSLEECMVAIQEAGRVAYVNAKDTADLKPDMERSLPSGEDKSSFSDIEDALDRAGAPMRDGNRWLTLVERIDALTAKVNETSDALTKLAEGFDMIDADYIGESMHTGLRKGSDAADSGTIWNLVANSTTTAWRDASAYTVECIEFHVGDDIKKAKAILGEKV